MTTAYECWLITKDFTNTVPLKKLTTNGDNSGTKLMEYIDAGNDLEVT